MGALPAPMEAGGGLVEEHERLKAEIKHKERCASEPQTTRKGAGQQQQQLHSGKATLGEVSGA